MLSENLFSFFGTDPLATAAAAVVFLALILLAARNIIARGILAISKRTKTTIDDILVKHIKPLRTAWLAPAIALYLAANQFPSYQQYIEMGALFVILWLGTITVSSLLNAANEIYESRPNYKGVSIQGYLEIVRILLFLVAVILSVSLFSGESPVVLLTGLGALTAVLLLVFQNTILALI
jgi:miniconductance mechanosensitive channel